MLASVKFFNMIRIRQRLFQYQQAIEKVLFKNTVELFVTAAKQCGSSTLLP
jgi:hypothetical protein